MHEDVRQRIPIESVSVRSPYLTTLMNLDFARRIIQGCRDQPQQGETETQTSQDKGKTRDLKCEWHLECLG